METLFDLDIQVIEVTPEQGHITSYISCDYLCNIF